MTAKQERTNTAKVANGLFRSRSLHKALAAVLLLSTSSVALHAQDRDLQRELDALKAQISALKAAVSEQRTETRKNKEKIKVVADRAIAPPLAPPGYTAGGFQPIGGFDDKKLHFGGITLTPGGYVAADGIFRSRTTGADVTTPYAGAPFPNSPLSNTNETRLSVRQSRAALLVEGQISPSILGAGYFEADFNTASATTNFNQTNSFTFRVRNLYATLDFLDTGFHVLAGQNWSLITTNSKGITPRNEILPPGPDSGVQVGYLYARQPQIRLVKDFDKKLWLALSAEESATSVTGCNAITSNTGAAIAATTIPGNGVANVTCLQTSGALGAAGQNSPSTSLTHIPDIFGKIAYEARIADRDVHFEAVGAYRNFYDRVNYGAATIPAAAGGGGFAGGSASKNTNGFAAGGSIVAAVIPKVLDFTAQGYVGRGLGRYTSTGLPDAALSGDGSLSGIRNLSGNAGFTYHATSKLDFYAYAGIDKVYANYSANGAGGFVGYGVPTQNNSGCFVEGSANCGAATGSALELTGGVWDKIYEGPYGYFRAGVQYEFVRRQLLPGLNGQAPSVNNHVIFTSLRYFPF